MNVFGNEFIQGLIHLGIIHRWVKFSHHLQDRQSCSTISNGGGSVELHTQQSKDDLEKKMAIFPAHSVNTAQILTHYLCSAQLTSVFNYPDCNRWMFCFNVSWSQSQSTLGVRRDNTWTGQQFTLTSLDHEGKLE